MENESESKECMYIGKYDYMEKNVNRNQTEKEMEEKIISLTAVLYLVKQIAYQV